MRQRQNNGGKQTATAHHCHNMIRKKWLTKRRPQSKVPELDREYL